jgi:D-3-phosphoglycerate dehydrogenase
MLNKSKGEIAYTLVDTDNEVPSEVLDELRRTSGVLHVRYLPVDAYC